MPALDVLKTALQGNKTGRIGGQFRNQNALSHGFYQRILSGRTKKGKLVRAVYENLLSDQGGDDVSTARKALTRSTAVLIVSSWDAEAEILCRTATPSLRNDYLRCIHQIRENLKLLGLERKPKEALSLQDYLLQKSQHEGESEQQFSPSIEPSIEMSEREPYDTTAPDFSTAQERES